MRQPATFRASLPPEADGALSRLIRPAAGDAAGAAPGGLERGYLAGMAALGVATVAVIALLPVLPGQDIPQHLAYIRILADHGQREAFSRTFEIAALQPYHVTHHALSWIARFSSPDAALRLLLSAYALGQLAAFHRLVTTVHPRHARAPWAAALGAGFVFGPLLLMGFVPFVITVPVFVLGVALLLRAADPAAPRRAMIGPVVIAIALASLHPFAVGCFVLFALTLLPGGTAVRKRRVVAVALTGVVAFTFWWGLTGPGAGLLRERDLADLYRRSHGLDLLDSVLGITWRGPTWKATDVLDLVLGPYRWGGKLVAAVAVGAAAFVVLRGREPAAAPSSRQRALFRAAILFSVVAWLAPWGIEAPTELSYIGLRLLALALPLWVALLPPAWLAPRAARVAVIALAFFYVGHFALRASMFAAEARGPLSLVERVPPDALLKTVIFHDQSDDFGEAFGVAHFLPVYFTARRGGITTQFWGRFTSHLPVAYRDGMEPVHAPDWSPAELRRGHLRDPGYLLVSWPNPEDDPRADLAGADQVRRVIGGRVDEVACEGLWCLYRVPGGDQTTP